MKDYVIRMIKTRPLLPIFVLAILFSAVYTRFFWKYPTETKGNYENKLLTGTVNGKASNEDGSLKYIIVEDVIVYPGKGNVLTNMVIGSEIRVRGDILPIEPPMNRGEYDSKFYNGVRNRFFYMTEEGIEIINTPKISVKEKLLRLRLNCYEKLKEDCPFEYGTVATLMFADKRGVSDIRKDLYKRVGCAHFLVISGLHVSLFGGMLYRLFRRLFGVGPGAGIFTLLALVCYGALAGFEVSVIRAIIMFSVRLLADIVKETYDMLSAVMLAAIIALAVNPLLVADTSFIYSYGTVFAIGIYQNTSEGLLSIRKEKGLEHLKGLLKLPTVIMLSMLPIALYLSYEYSLLSVFINLVLMPLSVPILILSFLCTAFALQGMHFFASISDFFLALILRGFDYLCGYASKFQGMVIWGKPALWQLVVYYSMLAGFWLFLHKKSGQLLCFAYYLAILSFVTNIFLFKPYMSALYVGQGDCIILRTGAKTAVMLDCGSTSEKDVYRYKVLPFLKAEGIRNFQAVFVSHGDEDHVNGINALLDELGNTGIKVDKIICSETGLVKDGGLIALQEKAHRAGVTVEGMQTGDCISLGNWLFVCVHPEGCKGKQMSSKINSNSESLVLYALNQKSGFDALFTGDIDFEAEERIMSVFEGKNLFLLKVAHHGSKYGTGADFLSKYGFSTAVISAGKNNIYGHPHRENLERLREKNINVYITYEAGEIDFFTE